jgi:HlyD family secretion protein
MAIRQARRSSTSVWIISAVAIVIIFYAVHLLTRSKLPVRVQAAAMGNLTTPESTNGKVEPQPQANFEAHAPFAGIVSAVYVREGDKVPAGKLLVTLDDTEAKARVAAALAALRGAQAAWQAAEHGGTQEERLSLSGDLKNAVATRDQAQHDLNALRKLAASGAASPSEVSAAEQRLAADNNSVQLLEQRQTSRYDSADLAHAKASLDDAQAAYDAAQDSLNQAIVRAPFAGTVYSLPVSRTEYVQQGDRLLSLGDLSKLQVRAYFDEPEIGQLQVGQPAVIIWDALQHRKWHGHVARVPSTVINYNQTRNVGEVLIALDDPDGQLLPDTNVRVTVTVANESNVLIVPRDALHAEGDSRFVYRIEHGSLHRTAVTVGKLNLTDVEILHGLSPGDEVALTTTNAQPLVDGEPVKIVD